MFLRELFATIRARHLSSQRLNEEGVELTKRLLDATKPRLVEELDMISVIGGTPQSRGQLEGKNDSGWFQRK